MKVVVVESPAKAKTINKYLGPDYTVLASYGHVRDLPAKDGSVQPDNAFEMSWQTDAKANKHVKDITDALLNADKLILATDPDREGEAISWHVQELVRSKKSLRDIPSERVVFNEITKSAILSAMEKPRDIDYDLVNAYLARRALDYLVGFNLSPVLWRKLPGAKSAGRVQSVALRLICNREADIEAFNSQEYWSIDTVFKTENNKHLTARVVGLDASKIGKLDIASKEQAKQIEQRIKNADFLVESIDTKRTKRQPSAPFTTSTLQQEASRKLGFSASRTMQIAQRLYEGIQVGSEATGLITYMRTDGVQMSNEAIHALRDEIGTIYGTQYLPEKPRFYKTKAANAQEAHEAIRPTSFARHPNDIRAYLDYDQFRLYDLIWKRAVASQMAVAELDQTTIQIFSENKDIELRCNGSVIVFDGFRRAYFESKDEAGDEDNAADDKDSILPAVTSGSTLTQEQINPEQHFTQPPPRFSDASLVKNLEELGIGRPSTYASILQVLEKRGYVRKDQKRFIPEHRGRIVSTFLENFFQQYVQYDFTASLENQLDDVSGGRLEWKQVLSQFWQDFKQTIDSTKDLPVPDVMEALDKDLEKLFFKPDETGKIDRVCSKCNEGYLELKLSKYGPFIGCSKYPDCSYTKQVHDAQSDDDTSQIQDNIELGIDPQTQMPIWLKKGPYGWYVQQGGDDIKKPKRTGLPKGVFPDQVTLAQAISLLSLPRDVGLHPETREMIQAGIGRYGPFLKHQGKFVSLPVDDDVLSVGINRAVDLLAAAQLKAGRTLGVHPDGGDVELKRGRFGSYVEHKKLRASLPRGTEMSDVTLEQAILLLQQKAANPPKAKKAAKKTAKKTAKKVVTKPSKTSASKKTAPKKAAKKSAKQKI
jgi:DNA topoisomerase I